MERVPLRQSLRRGLCLRCPHCGAGRLFRRPFFLHRRCPSCSLRFQRENGYFVGAVYVNVIATEGLLLSFFLVQFLRNEGIRTPPIVLLSVLAVALPILFLHHSRSIWMAVDFWIQPPRSHEFATAPERDAPSERPKSPANDPGMLDEEAPGGR